MAIVSGGGGGGGGGPVLTAIVTLTSAQVLALGTTPFTLISAPGANKIVIPWMIVGRFIAGPMSLAYTFPVNDHIDIAPANDPTTPFSNADATSAQMESASIVANLPQPVIMWDSPVIGKWNTGMANQAWVMSCDSGLNPILGDGSLKVVSLYYSLDVS